MRPLTRWLMLASLAVLVGACSDSSDPTTTTTTAPSTTAPPRECLRVTQGTSPIDTGELATDAISLSGETFTCAEHAVVVPEGDLDGLIAAAQLAAALESPLLFPHPRLAAELGRLRPEMIHVIGELEVQAPPSSTTVVYTVAEALEETARALEVSRTVELPASPTAESIVETVKAIEAGDRVAVPGQAGQAAAGSLADPAIIIPGLAGTTASGPVWLVDASDPVTILLAASIAHAIDAAVVAADFDDLFRWPELGPALSGYPDRAVRQVGSSRLLDDWKLRTLVKGQEIPGGGFELFPAHINRRFVAFYGHPRSTTLGAMGQVTPEQALVMMNEGGFLTGYSQSRCLPSPCRGTVPPGLLAGFGADGAHVVPTFNYIATVAQPRCRSGVTPVETFREGVDVAAANGGYVMLDLQPGSTRFIEQARIYEELLRLPHVGLALDPEWRCGWPDQTEFNRIGTVTAEEVNEVINWLADLVNQEALPQKLLLIQQFRLDMIQDRDRLANRPEIQVVIQMDGEGQGNLSLKDRTWGGVTRGTEDAHFMWGWKNFFVRDHPNGPYSPAETLDREPVPVYISYQ